MAAELATTVVASMLGAMGPRRVDLRRLGELASAAAAADLEAVLVAALVDVDGVETGLLAAFAAALPTAFAAGFAPVLAVT